MHAGSTSQESYPATCRFIRKQGKRAIGKARQAAISGRATSAQAGVQTQPNPGGDNKPVGRHQGNSVGHLRRRQTSVERPGTEYKGLGGTARFDLAGWRSEDGKLHLYRSNQQRTRHVTHHPELGTFEEHGRIHTSRKSFNAAIKSHRDRSLQVNGSSASEIAPVAWGFHVGSLPSEEFHSVENGLKCTELYGRAILGFPRTGIQGPGTTGSDTGDYFADAVVPLSPVALGGRAGLEANEYEQCKLLSARVVFIPTQPTSQDGSIFLVYAADAGVRMDHHGSTNLSHLAQRGQYSQGPVWAGMSLDIIPQDANLRYFDNASGDYRTEVQGVVACGAASSINGLYDTVIGTLIIEYHFKYFAATLDYEIPLNFGGSIQFKLGTGTTATTIDTPVEFGLSSLTTQVWFSLFSGAPADIEKYYGILTITHTTQTGKWANNDPNFYYHIPADDTAKAFAHSGATYFLRFFVGPAGLGVAFLFTNLLDASNAMAQYAGVSTYTVSDGQLVWNKTSSVATGADQLEGYLRLVPLATDASS